MLFWLILVPSVLLYLCGWRTMFRVLWYETTRPNGVDVIAGALFASFTAFIAPLVWIHDHDAYRLLIPRGERNWTSVGNAIAGRGAANYLNEKRGR